MLHYLRQVMKKGRKTQKDTIEGSKRKNKSDRMEEAFAAALMFPTDPPRNNTVTGNTSISNSIRRKIQKFCQHKSQSSNTELNLNSKRLSQVSSAEAQKWRSSFECLLTDKNGLELFRGFLQSEYSEENIEFWAACEKFKKTRKSKLASRAQKICDNFVNIAAPRQVNLDSNIRSAIINNLENPTRDMFNQAQQRIQLLMENDSSQRFFDSETYRRLSSSTTETIL